MRIGRYWCITLFGPLYYRPLPTSMIGNAMTGLIETPGRIEPCLPDDLPLPVTDLVASLSARASILGSRLHARTRADLAGLVRIMNCYYSNLIEGHDTHPRDIERALAGSFAEEKVRRNLQAEAAAHVRVQCEVDAGYAAGDMPEPASEEFIRWLHREFYRDAPPEMLRIANADQSVSFDMAPGEYRSLPMHDVSVGRHVPPSGERVTAFMAHFSSRYRFRHLGQGSRIVAMAASHHRLNYVHPFPDGNGRVSRLMSHAMAHAAGIGAGGLWSISRGLARGLESRGEYKLQMDAADMPRQGSLDGRGNLSLRALLGFIETLRGAARDDAAARERFLSIMAREAERMNRLVADLLSLTRVESEERVRPTAPVDLAALVRSAAASLRPVAEAAGVEIELTGTVEPLTAPGDADQLTQVLTNLIENALKYGGPGPVTVSLSAQSRDPVLKRAVARIDVIDRGEGIDDLHLPRLTERFYRVDSHRSREKGGTGLGLAIVKHIVNRHRGRLKIESRKGEGSRFTVLLPRSEAMEPEK